MKRLMVGLVVATMLVAMVAVPAMALTSKVLVAGVSPDGGSANVGADSNITATFNIRMAKSTINNKTFYLKQDGSTAVVPAQVAYTGTTKTATLKPNNDLASGATYTAYVKGGRTGVRGTGGQKLGNTTDTTAIFTDAKVSWTFTVATPPDTTIDSGPPSLVNSRSASFRFSSSESGSTFECSLDGGPFEPCESPEEYAGLSEGPHTFTVRAIDAAGNVDDTPASHTWTVETTAPTINNVAPANTATDVASVTNVRVTFSEAMDEASVEAQGTFTLKQGSSPVEATVAYDSTTKKATLDPSTDLALNTTYTATLTTEAKDLAGTALAQHRSWTFTTASAPRSVTVTPATLDLSVSDNNPLDLQDCERSALLTVRNNGPGNVTFAEVSITGPDAAHFSDGAKSFILSNGPFTVLAGNFFQDQVTFRAGPNPEDRVSSKTHRATLTYKDDTGATIGNPVSLTATAACLNFG